MTKKEIAKLIYEELCYMYCNNCRYHSEIGEDDPNFGCEDCHRKYNGWGISMAEAERIAEMIGGKVETEMSLPKWIPVSEKPKDEKKTYLVQLDSGGMCSCRWTNVNPFWTELTTDWHWNMFDIPQYCKVVAWMDLEPYREDGEA